MGASTVKVVDPLAPMTPEIGYEVVYVTTPYCWMVRMETTPAGERAFNRVMNYVESPKPVSVTIPPEYDPQKRSSMLPQYLTSGVMLVPITRDKSF